MTSYNDKRINTSERYKNYKYVCTKQQSTKIHESKTELNKGRNMQIWNKSWGVCYPIFNNRITIQKINKKLENLRNAVMYILKRSVEYFTQQEQNAYSSLVHMKHLQDIP